MSVLFLDGCTHSQSLVNDFTGNTRIYSFVCLLFLVLASRRFFLLLLGLLFLGRLFGQELLHGLVHLTLVVALVKATGRRGSSAPAAGTLDESAASRTTGISGKSVLVNVQGFFALDTLLLGFLGTTTDRAAAARDDGRFGERRLHRTTLVLLSLDGGTRH